jgi:hypothetical protein
MIVLSFYLFGTRVPWEYFVPGRGGYDWIVAVWDEKYGKLP